MKITEEKVTQEYIYPAINEIGESIKELNSIERTTDMILFGSGSVLDSLSLVTLIVSVEEKIEDDIGVAITLANEKAMSRHQSPFRTVQTFTDYIIEILEKETGSLC
jgi:D-alanine--poly(phosphoribitol) ligase subunit 2